MRVVLATEETDEGPEKSAREDGDGDIGRRKLSERRMEGEKKDVRVKKTRLNLSVQLKNDKQIQVHKLGCILLMR